jgi:O-antigen ligase
VVVTGSPPTRTAAVPALVVAAAGASLALLPVLLPTGPGNSGPVDAAIALCVAVTLLWAGSARLRLRLPYAIPVAVLLAAGAIAALAGPLPGLGLLELAQDVLLFAWCAALVNVARSPAAFRALVATWSWSSIAWAAVLIGAYVTGHTELSGVTPRLGARASLLSGDPNLAATYFFLSIMVVAAARSPRRRVLRHAGYALLLGALALTFSNGGALALAVAVAVTAVVWSARRFGLVPVATAAAAVLLVGVVAWSNVNVPELRLAARESGQPILRDSIGRSDQSVVERQTLIQESYLLFRDGGLLGWGPRATKGVLAIQQAGYINEAHNDYIAAVVERGLLGGVGLLLLIAAVAARAPALLRGRPRPAFAAVLPRSAPLLGALLGIAVFATNEQVLHFRQVWALLALVAAYELWAAESPSPRWGGSDSRLPPPVGGGLGWGLRTGRRLVVRGRRRDTTGVETRARSGRR